MVSFASNLCATFQITMPRSNSRSLTPKDDSRLTLSLTYLSALPSQHHDSFMNTASLGIAKYNCPVRNRAVVRVQMRSVLCA